MRERPAFFDEVRLRAAKRWDQLEADPELAAPWRQLFMQVQSPRHVVSELLQNADDAGATEAAVRIEDGNFIFEHNGGDFTEEHLSSLCRFGYSNKRALHTIGFRGIGFKSTFSLGDRVDLLTPTLAFSFHRSRFTEPSWLDEDVDTNGWTRVRVAIRDDHRQDEVAENLDEWLGNPLSLVFFRTIRAVQIGQRTVRWRHLRPGPIADSEWMALDGKEDDEVLILRSCEEAFPDEALAEIRAERLLPDEEVGDFPPCKVELALGARDGLYAVLPTGVATKLPFACNAPFNADPARLKIKDPGISPTNRWLLRRAGELAGSALLQWLNQDAIPAAERVRAYELLPDVDRTDSSLGGVCGALVEVALAEVIAGHPVLLTDAGALVASKEAVLLPVRVFAVWPTEPIAEFFDEQHRPALSRSVAPASSRKLRSWGLVDEVDKKQVLAALRGSGPPAPTTWRGLLHLWEYVTPDLTGYQKRAQPAAVRIIPVEGSTTLWAAGDVVRLGDGKILQSEEDWGFLSPYLRIVDTAWLAYLADEQLSPAESSADARAKALEAAKALLKELGLDRATSVHGVVDRVSGKFFGTTRRTLADAVRLSHIVAKLGGRVPEGFQFYTEDGNPRSVQAGVVWDRDGLLGPHLPADWIATHLLHGAYSGSFVSCSRDEWRAWAFSDRSGLHILPTLDREESWFGSRRGLEARLRELGYGGEFQYPYKTGRDYAYQDYGTIDFDFDPVLSKHLQELPDDDALWRAMARLLLEVPDKFWRGREVVEARQTSTNGGNEDAVRMTSTVPAAWVRSLARRPVLRDTRDQYRRPDEMLRRTPETEALRDIEPFVDAQVDTEAARPLLDVLGVRSTPSGPKGILERLRALSGSSNPPGYEVDKWYGRLDQMAATCSTGELGEIRQAFHSERLILTQDGIWASAPSVFLATQEEDVPGAATVRPTVGELALWQRIGVADRPTADLALAWLKSLPSGRPPAPADVRRVRALLGRYPVRIWEECAHWLNLSGAWVPADGLRYALTMQSLVSWEHLFPGIKDRTALLLDLPGEVTRNPPFSHLQALSQLVEDRLDQTPHLAGQSETKAWLHTLSAALRLAELDNDGETQRVRALATRLMDTRWARTPGLSTTPYIDGTPAGPRRRTDVVWHGSTLHVDDLPTAKLARRIPEELGRVFGRPEILAALAYSFERSPVDVLAYIEENFRLATVSDDDGQRAAGDATTIRVEPGAEAADRESDAESAGSSFAGHEGRRQAGERTSQDSQSDSGEAEPTDSGSVGSPRHRATGPALPSLIERFAREHGFRKNEDGRFCHPDGSWISRADDTRSMWERWSANGELVCSYKPIDHCLDRGPLVLDAEIWGLIEESPSTYGLILLDAQGGAVEMTGTRLRAMRDANELTLFPASYRLVVDR
jgi:hypothetical protein